jgi:hypothetical protein
MRVYAEQGPVLRRQILSDLLVAGWVVLWLVLATKVHDLVMRLTEPGRQLEQAGQGVATGLSDAGQRAQDVPLAGDALAAPFEGASGAASQIADAGHDAQVLVERLAVVSAVLLFAVPVVLLALAWAPRRVAWMRDAASRIAALEKAALGLPAAAAGDPVP